MCYNTSFKKQKNQITAVLDAVHNVSFSYEPHCQFNGSENKNLSIIKQDDETISNLRSFTH